MKHVNKNIVAIPILTFALGFCTFVLISIKNNVFWFDSPYDIPLIYNVSVIFGDSILLPITNYMVFNLLINKSLDLQKESKSLKFWFVIFLIISIWLNIDTHIAWKNDNYTDFISYQKGKLEFVGYWHCAYSIIEVVLFFNFYILWLLAIKQKNNIAVKYAHKIWKVVFLFSTLSIFDMIGKCLFIYKYEYFSFAKLEITPFSVSLISLLGLLVMKNIEKRSLSNNKLKHVVNK